ncbi:unnamed protein product [Vitrella brassicaformis CCMP3155]|uniref:Uncharacterized protein n=1 Tax=Vitrella brassicaformis (strain CCMP3155) TaxID=1169540 RepID=A0A0G4G5F1_VITBC|nr:unnamed protein product [Vitrella brassicaformis CCMP3155]|eukprot:CEM23774.1 unnamed protein product [Vitrella brassicaformis CCMP3155]
MASSAHGQQPDDCLRLSDIEIGHGFYEGIRHQTTHLATTDATRQLTEGILFRTFTHQQQVTDLIRRDGANPNSAPCLRPRLRVRGSGGSGRPYRLLALAIDNMSDNAIIEAVDSNGRWWPLALPHWSSPELEAAILNALIDGGARINGRGAYESVRMAVCAGNQSAANVFLAAGQELQYGMPPIMELPTPIFDRFGRRVSPGYEQRLLSIFRRFIQYDPTLAAEESRDGGNLIYMAARNERRPHSQAFIDSYLELLVENGSDVTAVNRGLTPLHVAAGAGSPYVADFLSRRVAAADINRGTRGTTGWHNETPLYLAVSGLDGAIRVSQAGHLPQDTRNRASGEIPLYEATIRSLLRSGADIGRLPITTPGDRRCRNLVLTQCTAVLNTDIHTGAMAALNAALAPQRPHEAEAISWRIAAMCFDQDAANDTIAATLTVRNSDMARRVCAAVDHFVKSALYASSNREVVGGTADVGGVTVRMPLQCFALRADSRPHQVVHTRGRVGVREVVQRARLDEAARHGIEEGAINKGFNEHWGSADCEFDGWQQLGRIDERGQWVTLGIN